MSKGHKHKKKIKSEKAKVKLKKADNVTNTSFKVKQIIVREQLKVVNNAEPLSKRKLNIKELLLRLQHYNLSVRNDAVTGLKEIATLYPQDVIIPNLNQLLQGILHLVLDKEKTVRRDGIKLISIILSAVNVHQIEPFFDILCSHLRCAMTHINTDIQEDSLLLMDVLLNSASSLVAQNSSRILPYFFDLISKLGNNLKPGRTLTMNLGSKITSVKWRTKVLSTFLQILSAIVIERETQLNMAKENFNLNHSKTALFNSEKNNYISINNRQINALFTLNFDEKRFSSESSVETEETIIKYLEILVPLLFDIWLEVGPNKANENNIDSTLSSETVSMLSSILKIFQMFWKYILLCEKETGTKEISNKFKSNYSKNFSNYFVKYFPYMNTNIKKRRRDENKLILKDSTCLQENLLICYLFCVFNKKFNMKSSDEYANKIIDYVKLHLIHWKPESKEVFQCLLFVLQNLLDISESWSKCNLDMTSVIDAIISFHNCKYLTENMRFQLFNIMTDILNHKEYNRLTSFQIWLSSLPDLLCKSEISEKIIDIVSLLGKQNNTVFNCHFIKKFPGILRNLENVNVIDNEDKYAVLHKLIQSFYWLSIYDEQNITILKNYIKNSKDEKIKNSFINLLKLRHNLREDNAALNALQELQLSD